MTEVTYKVYFYEKDGLLDDVSADYDTERAALDCAEEIVDADDCGYAEIMRVEATAIKRVAQAKKIVVTKL